VPGGQRCYTNFKSRADTALTNLRNSNLSPVVSGMLWMQGESDTTLPGDAAAYDNNLTHFISTVRTAFNTPDMPFVLGRILTVFGPEANNTLVRNAQVHVADTVANVSWVDTDHLELSWPGHYGTQGQIDLGNLFAAAIAVPEPSTWWLAAVGLIGLLAYYVRGTRWAWPQSSSKA
jgi:hypothetical protein